MAKISKEEYQMLKSLGDDWEWIARDSGGDHGGNLFAYSEKPFKCYDVGEWDCGIGILFIGTHRFQFIQWEDGQPFRIAELVEGYERESEEKEMKKSIELLKGEIEKEIRMWDGVEAGWSEEAIDKIFNLIDEFLLSEKGSDCDDK